MPISKQEYILRSLKKISHKQWELFIISRILHVLDDDEIEFVTQQLVQRSDGSRALTDMYFPQFDLHLEIDEPYHNNQGSEDIRREQDIVQVTGHRVERIKVLDESNEAKEMGEIRNDVDKFVGLIKELKINAIAEKCFIPWDWEGRYSAEPVIDRGYVSIKDNVLFRTQVEAMRCFGFKGKGWQRGAWTIPDGSNDLVWFPRLYPHGMWHNELADNGQTIYERAICHEGIQSIKKQREDN